MLLNRASHISTIKIETTIFSLQYPITPNIVIHNDMLAPTNLILDKCPSSRIKDPMKNPTPLSMFSTPSIITKTTPLHNTTLNLSLHQDMTTIEFFLNNNSHILLMTTVRNVMKLRSATLIFHLNMNSRNR